MKPYAPKGVELNRKGGNFQQETIRNGKNYKVLIYGRVNISQATNWMLRG